MNMLDWSWDGMSPHSLSSCHIASTWNSWKPEVGVIYLTCSRSEGPLCKQKCRGTRNTPWDPAFALRPLYVLHRRPSGEYLRPWLHIMVSKSDQHVWQPVFCSWSEALSVLQTFSLGLFQFSFIGIARYVGIMNFKAWDTYLAI